MTSETPAVDDNEKRTPEEGAGEEARESTRGPAATEGTRTEPARESRDRGDRGDRGYGRPSGGRYRDAGRRDRRGMRRPRRKVCAFCVDKVRHIDYKDYRRLRGFVSERGKILKSRQTGNCAKHQRALTRALKRARLIALLPFVSDE